MVCKKSNLVCCIGPYEAKSPPPPTIWDQEQPLKIIRLLCSCQTSRHDHFGNGGKPSLGQLDQIPVKGTFEQEIHPPELEGQLFDWPQDQIKVGLCRNGLCVHVPKIHEPQFFLFFSHGTPEQRSLTHLFDWKLIPPIISACYFSNAFVMALPLLIIFLIVLPGCEHIPKAEYIVCCLGSGRVLFLTCTTSLPLHCIEIVTRFWPANCFLRVDQLLVIPAFFSL